MFIFAILGSIAALHGFNIWKLIGTSGRTLPGSRHLVVGIGPAASDGQMENAGAGSPWSAWWFPDRLSVQPGRHLDLPDHGCGLHRPGRNTPMDLSQQITLLVILLLTSKCGWRHGKGFIVLAATLSAVGTVPVAGLALILGIDRFMSEARALTNFIGNSVATLVVAKWCKGTRHRQDERGPSTTRRRMKPTSRNWSSTTPPSRLSPRARPWSNTTELTFTLKAAGPSGGFFAIATGAGRSWENHNRQELAKSVMLSQVAMPSNAIFTIGETMKITKLLVGLVAGTLSFAAAAQQPIVIKFSHVVAQDTQRVWPPTSLPKSR